MDGLCPCGHEPKCSIVPVSWLVYIYGTYNPSSPAAWVRFPAGSGILIPFLGLSVCPLSVYCPVLSSVVLTTHSERPALVYLSSVLVHSRLLPLQASDSWAFGL